MRRRERGGEDGDRDGGGERNGGRVYYIHSMYNEMPSEIACLASQ